MKISKLYNRPDYKTLFSTKPFLVSQDFSIWKIDNNLPTNVIRFGVIVPKKKIKKAVDRNKAKRIAKELFKNSFKYNQSKIKNKDLVLVIKNFDSKKEYILKEKLLGIYNWLYYFMSC